jgi:hypothetical protein
MPKKVFCRIIHYLLQARAKVVIYPKAQINLKPVGSVHRFQRIKAYRRFILKSSLAQPAIQDHGLAKKPSLQKPRVPIA